MSDTLEAARTFPLTPGQRLLWDDLSQYGSHSNLNIGSLVILPVSVEIAAFYRAFAHTLDLHDAFSLALVEDPEGDRPLQRLEPRCHPMMELLDLSGQKAPIEAVHKRAQCLMTATIDSFGPCLYRSQLVDLGAAGTAWIFVANHMIADGWSLAIFVDHVVRTYAANSTGGSFKPEVESFVSWASSGNKRDPSRNQAYWEQRLCSRVEGPFPGMEQSLTVSTDTTVEVVPSQLHERMAAFCTERGTNPQCLILAALGVVLSESQGMTNWTMELTTSNRGGRKLRRMSGQHAGVHPFPWEFRTEQTMGELLGQIGRRMRQDYRRLPFGNTVGKGRKALCLDVKFNSYPFDFLVSEIADQPVTIIPLQYESSGRALEVTFVDLGERRGRTVNFSYNSQVLLSQQVERIKDALFALIEVVLERPQASIADLAVEYPRPVAPRGRDRTARGA
ncbi:MAG: condensation domain-containing protein [Proteobacteria bacterium]|nr:condensation domain-containing protein [Pseudomonadota bacterium]